MAIHGQDIGRILKDWPFDPSKVNVRRIIGDDGKEKIQLRLDLGILQMEAVGRPDGKRPYGRESLLDYYLELIENYKKKFNSDSGFVLSSRDCAALQQEAIQYYHRYLSLFHLGDYEGVVRDTSRNLKVFDLIKQYAEDPQDRFALEQFRPYVLMMRARASASIRLKQKDYSGAIQIIQSTIGELERFFQENQAAEQMERSPELNFLRRWLEEVKEARPIDPIERLKKDMEKAVQEENYELAARLRDQIRELSRTPEPPKFSEW